jgi:pyruvate dehydrogenase E1 component beta subunit
MRKLSYSLAINEAFHQLMEKDPTVFVLGQGVLNPWYVGNSMRGIDARFGSERVIDPPVSENGMNGVVIGAALAGMRPIVIHPRMDFLLLGAEQIINEAANWRYMFGGQNSVPLVVRGIINRGGEQGAQHSQALQAMFAHVPGLKVVMPATPYDAKGLLISSVRDSDPVIYIDDRWLYSVEEEVPVEAYSVPLGCGVIRRRGRDVTVVATSYMVKEALDAANHLSTEGIEIEVIDPRTIKPLDAELILASVQRTGRLVVVDAAWRTCGWAAEACAVVLEEQFEALKAPARRVTLPDAPAPTSRSLEDVYYIGAKQIVAAVRTVVQGQTGRQSRRK